MIPPVVIRHLHEPSKDFLTLPFDWLDFFVILWPETKKLLNSEKILKKRYKEYCESEFSQSFFSVLHDFSPQ